MTTAKWCSCSLLIVFVTVFEKSTFDFPFVQKSNPLLSAIVSLDSNRALKNSLEFLIGVGDAAFNWGVWKGFDVSGHILG